jgi:hypothetical protein
MQEVGHSIQNPASWQSSRCCQHRQVCGITTDGGDLENGQGIGAKQSRSGINYRPYPGCDRRSLTGQLPPKHLRSVATSLEQTLISQSQQSFQHEENVAARQAV